MYNSIKYIKYNSSGIVSYKQKRKKSKQKHVTRKWKIFLNILEKETLMIKYLYFADTHKQ